MSGLSTDLSAIGRGGTLVLWLFTTAVLLSALLLFGVQPMFARMVLPQLGGSPSVWSVAMVFFQSMLLAGYAYAHLLTQMQRRWLAVAVHLSLMVGAALMLPKIRTRNTALNESLQHRRYTGRPPEKRLEVKKKF